MQEIYFYLFLLLAIGIVVLIIGLIWLVQPYFVWKRNFKHLKDQQIIINTTQNKKLTLAEFKEHKKNKDYHLSLVIPAYNEQQRLPVMINETMDFLKSEKYSYEFIVVNDGSKDKTKQIALQKGRQMNLDLVVIQYEKNRGKGGALRCGMAAATGKYSLMVDADGATTFSELPKVFEKMHQLQASTNSSLIMVVGSRDHLLEQKKVERKLIRKFVSGIFKFLITIICGIKTKDTQCGFKLFTADTAKILFQTMHLQRWAFDIQLFVICNKYKISTAQVPVQWHQIDGSKLNIVQASITMFRDIITINLLYLLRLWSFNDRVIIA